MMTMKVWLMMMGSGVGDDDGDDSGGGGVGVLLPLTTNTNTKCPYIQKSSGEQALHLDASAAAHACPPPTQSLDLNLQL